MRAYTVRYDMHVETEYVDEYDAEDGIGNPVLHPYAEVDIEPGFEVLAETIPNALRKFADQLERQIVERNDA